ncbi:ABC transporter permease subunit [Streptomyces alboflavus]|uniref:ABC transporter permease subunit n=1 Tax=Streptomyces alboflavus TaxID=67267 RepID=UPI00368EB23B
MTTQAPAPVPPITPYRSSAEPTARDGFLQLLRAEWTKFRTVRRWWSTLVAAVLVTVLISLFSASSSSFSSEHAAPGDAPPPATDTAGLAVQDAFHFVHRDLAGDGDLTVRVSGLTGKRPEQAPGWAKAGIILKESTQAGAPYAALMMTAQHGVRLQSGFTEDTAGSNTPAGEARWLRLERSGATVTGYESADGKQWRQVGKVRLDKLPRTVRAGMFVASPSRRDIQRGFGGASAGDRPTQSTARFDHVRLDDSRSPSASGSWRSEDVGRGPEAQGGGPEVRGGSTRADGAFTVTGSGDIAPGAQELDLVAAGLSGTQLGLVLIAALAVLFITSEYRRGMIRTTLAASPHRPRVLAAKALVIGAVVFVAGLIASVVSFVFSQRMLRDNGHLRPYFPEWALSDGPALRAVVGSAALLALIAVLALGLGALLRHTAAAITAVVVLFALPLILVNGLPLGLARRLQEATPLAGFAIQQTTPRHDQVATVCSPGDGCYPQGPWTGLLTLFLYAVAVLALAMWRLRKRDA